MDYISLKQAAQVAPGRPNYYTMYGWTKEEVQAKDGQRVRLRCVKSGGRLYTTKPWLDDFIAATTKGRAVSAEPTAA